MQLYLYEAIKWGGDGENDTIFLVSARSVQEAAELVDPYLKRMRFHGSTAFAETVCEIARDPRSGSPTIILGPCFQHAYDYGWKQWSRTAEQGKWEMTGG